MDPLVRMLTSLPVQASSFAERRPWVFPKHRFFEWEPKDERFCRKYGIGHEGPAEPCVIQVTDPFTGKVSLYVHPTLMAKFKATN